MDWQMTKTQVNQRAGHILNTGQWSDCTFVVGNENIQEVLI